MTLRIENGTPINISEPPAAGSPSLIGAASRASASLDVEFVHQELDSWCWAACTEMILSALQQNVRKCRVASEFLNKACCNGNVNTCNKGVEVEDIVTVFKQWDVTADFRRTVRFSTVRTQIDQEQKPLEFYISWGEDAGGHVIVVDGWRLSGEVRYVKIKDPWFGPGEVRMSDLKNGEYTVDNGTWENTWLAFEEN